MSAPQRLLVLAGLIASAWVAGALLRAYFRNSPIPTRFDRNDVGLGAAKALLVEFVSPYCYECKVALPLLKAATVVHGGSLAVIDARERPDLARKYEIRHTPTILVVDPRGVVRGGWLGVPPEQELESAVLAAMNGSRLSARGRAFRVS